MFSAHRFLVCFLLIVSVISVNAFWSGDDSKYIKKFAMMKVYESCFGDDVVREVRDEMRAAAARCAAAGSVGPMPPLSPPSTPIPIFHAPVASTARPATSNKDRRPAPPNTSTMTSESLLRLQALLQGLRTNAGANVAHTAFNQQPHPVQQPQFNAPGVFPMPFPATPNFHPTQHYPPSPYLYQPMPNPYYQPAYNPYYMQRASRDMRSGPARVRNVTCVMQELGYLDAELEPNYSGIIKRIERLSLPVDLRKDMVDAVTFCQKFSQCVPEPDQDKMQVSSDFSKPMIFFRCYKQKKLEACVLKDVRERFMSHAAAAGNSADDPEIPDHNGLDDDEADTPPASLRFRSRSGRTLVQTTSSRAAELAEVILGEDSLAL